MLKRTKVTKAPKLPEAPISEETSIHRLMTEVIADLKDPGVSDAVAIKKMTTLRYWLRTT